MKYASFNNIHNNCYSNYANGIFLQKQMFQIDRSIDQSLRPAGRRPLIILRLWDFYASGTQDAEAIKSLKTILFDYLRVTLVVEIKVFVCLRCLFTLRS